MTFKLIHTHENKGKTGLFVETEKPRDHLVNVCLGIQFFAERHIEEMVHISPTFYEIALPLVGFPCCVSYDAPFHLAPAEIQNIDLYRAREFALQKGRFRALNRLYEGDEILKQTLFDAQALGSPHHIFAYAPFPVQCEAYVSHEANDETGPVCSIFTD